MITNAMMISKYSSIKVLHDIVKLDTVKKFNCEDEKRTVFGVYVSML